MAGRRKRSGTPTLDRATRDRLLARLNRDARRIADEHGLRFRVVEAERAGVKRRYGACFDDGTIKIRLVRIGTDQPLRYASLLDTLCHELAHLKYWHHGARFQAYHRRLLAWAKAEGMAASSSERTPRARGPSAPDRTAPAVRPRVRVRTAAEQLPLFGGPGGPTR